MQSVIDYLHGYDGKQCLSGNMQSVFLTSYAFILFFVHRKHQEDRRQVIHQVRSRHKARHQKWQDRGQDPGESLLSLSVHWRLGCFLMGPCATVNTGLLMWRNTLILQPKQSDACIMYVQSLMLTSTAAWSWRFVVIRTVKRLRLLRPFAAL